MTAKLLLFTGDRHERPEDTQDVWRDGFTAPHDGTPFIAFNRQSGGVLVTWPPHRLHPDCMGKGGRLRKKIEAWAPMPGSLAELKRKIEGEG